MSTTSEEDHVERPINEYFQASAASKLPLVHVYVGPDRKLFIFPETLLSDRFEFFKSAFQSSFREGVEKAIDLPEDDPVAFAHVIDRTFQEGTRMKNKVAIEEVQLALAKTYVLADKLCRPDLALKPICPRAIRYVYENTSESAELRYTMVDMVVTKYHLRSCFIAEWMKKWSESATSHPQFHCDIMIELKKRTCQENDDEDDRASPSCIIHST